MVSTGARQSRRLAALMGVPQRLGLLYDFVNSLDERCFSVHGRQLEPEDEFGTPSDLDRWCRDRRIVGTNVHAKAADLRVAKDLRAVLREAISANGDDGVIDPTLFERTTRQIKHFVGIDADGRLALRPDQSAVRGALAVVLGEAFAASTTGDWKRLKMCGAGDCRWIFYDRTRPGTKRWCEADVCGNRIKMLNQRRRRLHNS